MALISKFNLNFPNSRVLSFFVTFYNMRFSHVFVFDFVKPKGTFLPLKKTCNFVFFRFSFSGKERFP